ncbi:TonB-dependent siderophore receptor [Cereibacter sphaeroides]|uniref:TonB-dependent siderophore receptor n=1 Tax=Cereibacter sphaeroides TaxID=1063 RepID=UPI00313DA0F4
MRQSFPDSRAKTGLGMRISLALLASTALVSGNGLSRPAAAQEASTLYAVPAGPLGLAITRFGERSGLQILYPADLVRGKQSPGVSGALTAPEALSRLLAGSGLTYRYTATDTVTIVALGATGASNTGPDGSILLDTISVSGGDAATEGSGSYATGAASVARGADSLKEVPQSVTVMTDKVLEDQNLTMMSEAMAKAPGVVAATDGSGNPQFFSRGFTITNYQVDNLGTAYESTFRPDFDLSIYDRVEVLRGAEGLFSAAGEPGGTVNLARKRPTDERQSSVSLAYGSWNNRRLEADLSGPLTEDGRLRGRMIGAWQDREYFYSPADEEKQVAYGILEYDLTPDTTIHAGATYQHQNGIRWAKGLPTYTDGTQLGLDRGIALNTDWSTRETTTWDMFIGAEHRFSEDWTLNFSAMRQRFDYRYTELSVGGPVDPATGVIGDPGAFSEDAGNHSDAVDLSISGRFEAWGREHKLVAGADWRRSDGKQIRNLYETSFPDGSLTIGDFPGLDLPPATLTGATTGWPAYGAKQQGVYARLDMAVSDRAHVIVGGRYGNYTHREIAENRDEDGNVTYRDSSFRWRETGIFTPYVGVTYDLTPDWTTYASFTEIYKPQGNTFAGPPENPTQLDPITGRNFELGAKGELMEGRLNVAAALYRIERNGEAVEDTRYGDEDGTFYLPLGKVVSQGVELEASGEIAPGWQVFAGYTYNQNKNENADAPYHALTPKHMFKLWTEYNLPGDLSKWTVGSGVTVKSKHANTGTYWLMGENGWTQPDFEIRQGGYAVWDAHVNYQVDDRWSVALNVNNLLDKTYYATLSVPNGGNWYGEPRNATLTLRGRF